MGKYNGITIKKAVEEINQSYFLPDIQREYVWLANYEEKKYYCDCKEGEGRYFENGYNIVKKEVENASL